MPILIAACLCFGSFGWGMLHHFRRFGEATSGMRRTALLGAFSAGLQMVGLVMHWKDVWGARHVFAIGFYLVSASLFWWAVAVSRGQLAACGQGQISARLLSGGPYRYVRHPFYTAYNLTWIAGLVATGWLPLVLPVTVMAWVYEDSVREEEQSFLHSSLAAEYRNYRRHAGRYLPKLPIMQSSLDSRPHPLDR